MPSPSYTRSRGYITVAMPHVCHATVPRGTARQHNRLSSLSEIVEADDLVTLSNGPFAQIGPPVGLLGVGGRTETVHADVQVTSRGKAARLAMSVAPSAVELGIESPKLQRLYQDWLDRRRDRIMPARKDFDILDLWYAIGDLNLLEVLEEPLRFRYRVHGSSPVGRLDLDLTGKTTDDLPDPVYRDMVRRSYNEVVETKAPKRITRDPYYLRTRPARWEAVILPLSSDGISVNMLLVGSSVL